MSTKTEHEIEIMKNCGRIASNVMDKVLQNVKSGVSKAELDRLAETEIKKHGGELSFSTVPGYRWATCITVNDEVVHGIPGDYILKQNDLVSVDLGVKLQGLHTDMARTVFIGSPPANVAKLIDVGKKALGAAIGKAVIGNRIIDISRTIQEIVEGAQFSVVRALVGHGIGKNLHEPPDVPGFVTQDPGPKLEEGATIAIEVIYTEGSPDVILKGDGWTISAKDASLSGLFEDTVAITKSGPLVLTGKN